MIKTLTSGVLVINRLRDIFSGRPLTLSISVVMLLMSVIMLADMLKLRGDASSSDREIRTAVAETLAIQLTLLAAENDIGGIEHSLRQFVNRHKSLKSAAMIKDTGVTLADFGDLEELEKVTSKSTLTHINVPIFNLNEHWGEVHVVFDNPSTAWRDIKYFGFLLIGSFIACLFYLRRILVQLDPSKVVPARVDTAFNMFTECVIILDNQLQILVVNEASERMIGKSTDQLLGKKLDDWPWEIETDQKNWQAPWANALGTGVNISDSPMTLNINGELRILIASCTVVGEDAATGQGVLVTLNDMTAIETKNQSLAAALRQLKLSEQEITQKNVELEVLATRDSLTGLYNRRAFLEQFEKAHTQALAEGTPLCCVMTDIDHFKRINDTFGHAVGDKIICAVAAMIGKYTAPIDVIGRYGGEEFVLFLPGRNLEQTCAVAEEIRQNIAHIVENISPNVGHLSASFGVALLTPDVVDVGDLIDRADQALYFGKKSGRNRVVAFSENIKQLQSASDKDANSTEIERAALTKVMELETVVNERSRDLEELQTYDSLTGFAKRTMFFQRVDAEIVRAQRMDDAVAVLSLEVKDLDTIISTFGHAATDELVVSFVKKLQSALRSTDLATLVTDDHSMSRITSNEYGILLSELGEVSHVMPVLTRLRRLLSESFVIDGQKIYLGASMGVAVYPQNGEDSKSLLEAAHNARMMATHMPGKFTHAFSSGSLDDNSREYIEIESYLHEAIAKNQFEVFYQPKLDINSNKIYGLEALLRWTHPIKGPVPADKFIPIAESSGLIDDITTIVFSQALAQLGRWRLEGWTDLKVSINVSALQLRQSDLPLKVLAATKKAQVPTSALELEITETTVIESADSACIVLDRLREAGVSISIDDFGAGYTSMALLADLPLDGVKIDRSFVQDLDTSKRNRALVNSVINLAHSLGLTVVAEGVESEEELSVLVELGCDEAQGYLISRPVNADSISELLIQYNNPLPLVKRA